MYSDVFKALDDFMNGYSLADIMVKFSDDKKSYSFELDAPGYSVEDISVDVDEKKNTISIVANNKTRGKKTNSYYLYENTDLDTVTAKTLNGVLTISASFKTTEESKENTRKIPVE